jgi:methionyl-tRNA formyltransferase
VDTPRVVLAGTRSAYTRAVWQTLRASGLRPRAYVLPRTAPGAEGPRVVAPDLLASTEPDPAPVFEVGRLDHPEAEALLHTLACDLMVVACFPRRLPSSWLRAVPLGCWNIHPSLLPAYRGPTPLFWQLRAGETRTGVTVHRMDAGWDTGPLLAQCAVALPEGGRAEEIDARVGEAGARLVVDLLARESREETRQGLSGASAQGFPDAEALVVPTSWPARRAFDFIRGAKAWGPFSIEVDGRTLRVRDAFRWSVDRPDPAREAPGEIAVRFSPGWVILSYDR